MVTWHFLDRVSCEQEEARREADDAHRAFAAYEGDLPTLLRVYEAFLKVGPPAFFMRRRIFVVAM